MYDLCKSVYDLCTSVYDLCMSVYDLCMSVYDHCPAEATCSLGETGPQGAGVTCHSQSVSHTVPTLGRLALRERVSRATLSLSPTLT